MACQIKSPSFRKKTSKKKSASFILGQLNVKNPSFTGFHVGDLRPITKNRKPRDNGSKLHQRGDTWTPREDIQSVRANRHALPRPNSYSVRPNIVSSQKSVVEKRVTEDPGIPDLKNLRISGKVKLAWGDVTDAIDEWRILLTGKCYSELCSTGNCILRSEQFKLQSSDENKEYSCGKCRRFGRNLLLLNSPPILDIKLSKEDHKYYQMLAPGPHIIIFVIEIGNVNEDDVTVYKTLKSVFGNDIMRHTIILFSKKDNLILEGMTIFGYVNEVIEGIQDALLENGRKYIAFDNNATGRECDVQIRRLLDLADNIVSENGQYFPFNFDKRTK